MKWDPVVIKGQENACWGIEVAGDMIEAPFLVAD